MKKKNLPVFAIFLVIGCLIAFSDISGQDIFFTSDPDSTAQVDETYTYDVNAVTIPSKLPITYSLTKSLPGMTMNSSSGIITWKPSSITSGGKVIVKAANNVDETVYQEFFIYVSDAITCPGTMTAYWKLDETGGPVYSDYYGDNDAYVTATGSAPVSVTGQIDLAQSFDPSNNNFLSVPYDPVLDWGADDDFSVEFWIALNAEDLEDPGVIVGRNEGSGGVHWWVGIDPEKKINFVIREGLSDYAQCVSESVGTGWHHVVVARDASANMIYLYKDGLLIDNDSYDGGWPGLISDSSLCIGWLRPGPGDGVATYPFDGKLDELIIHNNVLDLSQVSSKYAKGMEGKPACREGNFAPLFITTPPAEANEDSLYSYHYLARDIDGDPLVYDVEIPAWLNHNAGSGTLSGTPDNGDVGTYPVSIIVNDGSADTVFQNFNLTVNNVNDPPQLTGIEGTALSFTEGDLPLILTSAILVEDIDDATIESATVSVSRNYQNGEDMLAFTNTLKITGSWSSSTGVLTLTGNDTKANYQTALQSITYQNTSEDPSSLTRTFSFVINDGKTNSDSATRDATVIPVNDLPVITGHKSVNTPEDDTILVRLEQLIYSDVDNTPDAITITVNSGSHYTFSGNIVTPELNYHDTIHVNIQVSDLSGSVNYVLPVNVISVNDAPVFTFAAPPEASEGVFYFYTISAEDVDAGDVLTFSAPHLPSWLQLNGNMLTGKPGFQHVGENMVTIRVTDGKVNVDTTFVINVTTTNQKPYITSTPVTTVNEDQDYIYNIQYTDPDINDILILSALIIPGWLNLDLNQNRLYGKPTNDQVGFKADSAYLVKLRISDNKQDSTQTFEIVVKNINDAPVISGQAGIPVTYPDSSVLIHIDDLIVQDVDNPLDELEIIIFAGTGYSVIANTATINSSASGQIEIRLAVDDGLTESEEYGYKVNVNTGSGVIHPDVNGNMAIKVFPNPASEFVRFELNPEEACQIDIFSNEGRLIFNKSIDKGQNSFEFTTTGLPDGIYYFKVYSSSGVYTGKLTIRK
jgi:hypothetical protein